ncbi:MAG TPA: hypothetical protein VMD91_10270 [Candidatus Sulfotelmatobacter sp.]|nr:hypothetical protein [Candidatus Sulfotelmatobacter sp.]
MNGTVTLRAQLSAGLIAGVVGGILVALFFLVAISLGGGRFGSMLDLMQWVAGTVLGSGAATNPAAPWIALGLHFAVSILWALGYVYLVRSQPQLLSHPWISGAGFGLVVYVFMQIALIVDADWHRPSGPAALGAGLLSHIVFYGIPVGLLVSRFLRRA